uniref:Uncharacterized protein n=1 Tax=Solanum tuberosum TaxID=4113 RepID=M1DRS6_SOLTU
MRRLRDNLYLMSKGDSSGPARWMLDHLAFRAILMVLPWLVRALLMVSLVLIQRASRNQTHPLLERSSAHLRHRFQSPTHRLGMYMCVQVGHDLHGTDFTFQMLCCPLFFVPGFS